MRSVYTSKEYLAPVALLAFMSGGCESLPADSEIAAESTSALLGSESSPAKTVCDPFSDPTGDGASSLRGILGEIRALPSGLTPPQSALSYLTIGQPLEATLFLNQVFVPTRAFNLGFSTQAGQLLKTPEGNTLYENFSMHLETEIQLGAGDAAGLYQFALLADDGALLQLDRGNGFETIVNDDGLHATRMKCATSAVRMEPGASYPAKIHYYQGPRYHIALTLLWRPWGADPSVIPSETECGREGNSRFWDSTVVPSRPVAFANLLSRGWKPLEPANYALPRRIRENPCTVAEPVRTFITSTLPATLTSSTSAQFAFNSNKQGASYRCALDGALASACVSPKSYSALSSGQHHFQVWATDSSGTSDEVGAEHSWAVDAVAPSAFSVSTTATSTTITVRWSSSEPTTTLLRWGATQSLGNQVGPDAVYSTTHSATITGLAPGGLYYVQPGGLDEAGNAISPQVTSAGRTTR